LGREKKQGGCFTTEDTDSQRKARRKAKGFMACTAALALTASDVLILLDSYVEILRGADYPPLRMTVAFASRGYRDGSTRTAD
jgi:hypothetical protein